MENLLGLIHCMKKKNCVAKISGLYTCTSAPSQAQTRRSGVSSLNMELRDCFVRPRQQLQLSPARSQHSRPGICDSF
jgi:hypothetical protein